MEGDAIIEQFIGGYDDYLEQKTIKISQKNITTPSKPVKNVIKKRKLSYHQQQELNSLPKKIENLESEIFIAQQHLSDPKFYQDPEVINLTMKLREMELQLEVLYSKWSKLDSEK
jgi:ATP-binding cassette subfamily F protein uup